MSAFLTHQHILTCVILVEPHAEASPSTVEDQNQRTRCHGQSRYVMCCTRLTTTHRWLHLQFKKLWE